jgi:hypothetical protein
LYNLYTARQPAAAKTRRHKQGQARSDVEEAGDSATPRRDAVRLLIAKVQTAIRQDLDMRFGH